jgi:protein tyrosine phosphatase (PTP) superfamily phosphohydrolase (DUF442 family)
MKRLRFIPVLLLSAALASPVFAASPAARPETWAVAVASKSVTNLWRVEPDLYRSARPESAGFQELEKMGVKAVLDVESPADEVSAKGTSLKLYHVPMNAFGLRDESVLEAMRILSDPANRPIVIHCQHGADRTGAMMALYRVVVQGWTKEDALREMNAGGYHHSSWFSNLDRYVASADVDGLRKALKISKPASTLLAALAQAPADVATAAAKAIAPAVTTATAAIVPAVGIQTVATTSAAPAADPKAGAAKNASGGSDPVSTAAPSPSATPASPATAGNQR